MVVRVIEAKEDKVTMADLIADLKKSNKIDYSGAIFTFEGIVRGKEENMNLEKLCLLYTSTAIRIHRQHTIIIQITNTMHIIL